VNLPTRTPAERAFLQELEGVAVQSHTTNVERLSNFPAWTPRQNIARFLASAEIYRRILNVHGVIIEGGVAAGAGLFGWAHLASILEPYNYSRKIIGFDLAEDIQVWEDLADLASLHDTNRPIGHIPRIELVAGDASKTIPEYTAQHPELVVALLVCDFTTYEPTRAAMSCVWHRMPIGGVVVAGGIWAEEMRALTPYQLAWERVPWSTTLTWAVKRCA
jgi:hypothetical protein